MTGTPSACICSPSWPTASRQRTTGSIRGFSLRIVSATSTSAPATCIVWSTKATRIGPVAVTLYVLRELMLGPVEHDPGDPKHDHRRTEDRRHFWHRRQASKEDDVAVGVENWRYGIERQHKAWKPRDAIQWIQHRRPKHPESNDDLEQVFHVAIEK